MGTLNRTPRDQHCQPLRLLPYQQLSPQGPAHVPALPSGITFDELRHGAPDYITRTGVDCEVHRQPWAGPGLPFVVGGLTTEYALHGVPPTTGSNMVRMLHHQVGDTPPR